ncbi:ATP-binding protein [Nocardia callitridis]|uniref:Histidine kinase/HSP90-like ATPase domain-containing protein n=1 Tax=Nocardia callitridis TaxID=648753 RepID=A0ABP9K8T7_9NOCA
MERAVANLLQDADRYGGGVVAVTAELVGDEVSITVDDAGPGGPEADRARIFERCTAQLNQLPMVSQPSTESTASPQNTTAR